MRRSRRGRGLASRLALGLALALAGVLAGAGGVLAAPVTITYASCPSFSQLQADVQGIGGSGTVTFGPGAANCPITAPSTITLHYGASVTIAGNGLVLSGVTGGSPGTFDLLDLDSFGNLTLDHITLEEGQRGVGYVVGAAGTVTLTNSTVTGNRGDGLAYGAATVTNSTVSGNGGAGIDTAGTATVTDSTVSGNGGAGIDAFGATVTASILAGNGPNCALGMQGGLTDGGYNLSTDGTCGFTATGSASNVSTASLALQPLANNGGPTPTQALGPGSIAIDAIPLVNGQCAVGATTDQRGVARPQGLGCDVGAYEATAPATLTLSPGSTTGTVGTPVTEIATVKDAYGNPVADGTPVDFSVTGITTTSRSTTTTNGQASFSYTAILPGTDTLVASVSGTALSQTATIGWTLPASTPRASLDVLSLGSPTVEAAAATITGSAAGVVVWEDGPVSLLTARLTSLVASGPDATLYGTAMLTTGQVVTVRLDAVAGASTVRLRLSDGYDSGVVHVLSVRVSP